VFLVPIWIDLPLVQLLPFVVTVLTSLAETPNLTVTLPTTHHAVLTFGPFFFLSVSEDPQAQNLSEGFRRQPSHGKRSWNIIA